MDIDPDHMAHIKNIALEDVKELERKEQTYQGSWKRRGGIGAFMMVARKWDRLESITTRLNYDIFAAIKDDLSGKDGSALAEIRDLRRYLLLIEAEIVARNYIDPPIRRVPRYEDSNKHAKQIDDDDWQKEQYGC
jgi:hypothetical protein